MKTNLIVSQGVEGKCVYLNRHRITGPKPCGGGSTIHEFEVEYKEVLEAFGIDKLLDEVYRKITDIENGIDECYSSVHISGGYLKEVYKTLSELEILINKIKGEQ